MELIVKNALSSEMDIVSVWGSE